MEFRIISTNRVPLALGGVFASAPRFAAENRVPTAKTLPAASQSRLSYSHINRAACQPLNTLNDFYGGRNLSRMKNHLPTPRIQACIFTWLCRGSKAFDSSVYSRGWMRIH